MKVNEIFFSIQGESTYAGLPCVFVRLAGCNLRCTYCDTRHAYEEGERQMTGQVIEALKQYPASLVEITGGEPLLQEETPSLISALAEQGYKVLVETNGSVSIRGIDARATIIMDIKCPGSGMSEKMMWKNIGLLRPHDEIKFVLTGQNDYRWAIEIMEKYSLQEKHTVHMSPAFGVLEPHRLASWILEDSVNVRLHLQLHKYVWPAVERGV